MNLQPGQMFETKDGDRATVRRIAANGMVHFSYVGPPGKDGYFHADTSGRAAWKVGDFIVSFREDSAVIVTDYGQEREADADFREALRAASGDELGLEYGAPLVLALLDRAEWCPVPGAAVRALWELAHKK